MGTCKPRGAVDTFNMPSVKVNTQIPAGKFGIGDVIVKLPVPASRVMICAIGPTQANEAFGLALHFQKLAKDYSVNGVTDGSETWIQLHTGDLATTAFLEGVILEFPDPITQFYLDIIGTAGTLCQMTFACVDGFMIYWKPNLSTAG